MTTSVVYLRRLSAPNRVLGSAHMRGDQLVSMLSPYLENRLSLRVVPFHAGLMPPAAMAALAHWLPANPIVIIVKSAAKGLTRGHLAPLKRRGALIGFDSIDMPVSEIDFDLFDFHISASLAGHRAIERRLVETGRSKVPVELMHHHADPRISAGRPGTLDQFRCGYLGMPENVYIPPEIRRDVETHYVKYPTDFEKCLPRVRALSLHYAVRPPDQGRDVSDRGFKPFTKGFTAASCGANILVNRTIDDAEELLGRDYPYFVDSLAEAEVSDVFRRAADDFGGPTWQEGLKRMRALRSIAAPETLASRLEEICERVSILRGWI